MFTSVLSPTRTPIVSFHAHFTHHYHRTSVGNMITDIDEQRLLLARQAQRYRQLVPLLYVKARGFIRLRLRASLLGRTMFASHKLTTHPIQERNERPLDHSYPPVSADPGGLCSVAECRTDTLPDTLRIVLRAVETCSG
ncbi:hypothetical protein NLJ89_g11613 [Agrocybe chaxingu]|uniref:Uncharacterized protein n=1 Tax=Agrocybe chaxingu TaxID=84603 RepID=A0A9W8JNE3_9AGAR|nr:hypothetical protein NLJ89_g11613 [Agrocybe chaxingu]